MVNRNSSNPFGLLSSLVYKLAISLYFVRNMMFPEAIKQQEPEDFFKKCELKSLDFIFHAISRYCSRTKIISLLCWFKCCNFFSLFKNQQKTHLSRQCWLLLFFFKSLSCWRTRVVCDFIAIHSGFLTQRCRQGTSHRQSNVDNTCLPVHGPQRRAGSVEQVLLSSRSASCASLAAWLAP